jgi:hypothetical protein
LALLACGCANDFVAVTDDESDLGAELFLEGEGSMPGMRDLLGHDLVFHAVASEDVGGGNACADLGDLL